jgi:hypothetical protein
MVLISRILSSGMLRCVVGLADRLFQKIAVAPKCHDLLTLQQGTTTQGTESSF